MQQKKRHRSRFARKSFLLTMIFSMVVLICIPLLAVQLWLVQQSAHELQESNTEAYISALRNNAHSYETQLEMLDYNALKITADKAVEKPLDPKANGYHLFLAAQVIKGYEVGLPSVEAIGFYYPGKDSFLMNGYQPPKDLFFESIGATDLSTQQELMDFLHNLEALDAFFVRNEDSYGRFLIARPVYLESQTSFDGVVIYVLNPDDLTQTFQVNMPSGSDLAIVSKTGQWLVYNAEFPMVVRENEEFAKFLANNKQPYFEITYNQQRLDIYKYTDENTDNIFLASVMQADSRKQLTDYVNRMAMFIAGSMALLVVLFATTVYINYKPVKKLVSRHSAAVGGANLSELELLDSAFFARDAKISDQQSLLASFVLGDLIYGASVEEDLLDKQFDLHRLRYYTVITVSTTELNATQANAVAEQLRQTMENAEVYTTSMPNRPHVLFVVLAEKPIDVMMVKADLHHSLHTVANCEAEVRIGVVVQQLRDLRKSYYSSFSEPIPETESGSTAIMGDYPVKEVQNFVQNVCTGEKEKALQSLEKIEVMLGVRRIRPSYRQYYCYKLLSAFLVGIKENQIPISEEDVDSLMTFRNPTRLYALLFEVTGKCCDAVATMQESINARLQTQLFDYVNENIKNCELCLMSVADHMNISIYAVSRLFKERTGTGFKEYITSQRLEMAYRLLRTTDENVVDIGRNVGFESASYFSTAFRKKFGMSPVQARNGAKHQPVDEK